MKNKKLIASLTLAGFMATSFVPAAGLGLNAAYAAAADVSVSASYLETADVNPEVDVNETVEVKVGLLNRDNQAVADPAPNFVVVWAESTAGRADDAVALVSGSAEKATAEQGTNGMIKLTPSEAAEAKLQVKFARAGSYTLHAAFVNEEDYNALKTIGAKTSDYRAKELTTATDKKTIKVAAKTSVDGLALNGGAAVGVDGTTAAIPAVKDNGIEAKEATLTIYRDKQNNITVGRGVKVTFETNSNNIQLDKKEATTGNGGTVSFKVTGTNEGEYKVYVRAEGKEFTVPVVVSNENRVDNLVQTKAPAAPISVADAKAGEIFKDDLRFEFKDRNGNTVKTVTNQPALKNSDAGYVKVVEKPAKSKVEGKDFKLVAVAGKDYYAVQTDKDLVAGKYVVRFALENGKYAEAMFEVAEFGKAVALKVEYDAETVELNQVVKAPDIYFVDEKGVKKKATDVNIGFSGYAVQNFEYANTANRGSFQVKNDEKYLGSKITVTAVADRQNLVAVAELSVAQDGRGLKFATNSGVVNTNNTVEFKIVDGAGKSVSIGSVSNVNGVNAIVLSSSNKDAVVSTNITPSNIDAAKGEGKLTVTSTKPTTAEIQVFVRDINNKYYAGTLTYTFGETAQNATVNRFVVMSINNEVANVNNVNVKLDAAPIVKMNRTFVPFRAVAEAFGAEVGYDEATKKVTTKLDGKTLELTLGSKKLVVNGQEKAMDVEPFAQNSRTMVPVRFVAEELGFKVTAVRDAKKGGTAAVVFSR